MEARWRLDCVPTHNLDIPSDVGEDGLAEQSDRMVREI